MQLTKEQLKKILVDPGHISESKFEQSVKNAEDQGVSVEHYVVENGFIQDDDFGRLVAYFLGVKFINVVHENINRNIFDLIPEVVARSQGVIAINLEEGGVGVGMIDPLNIETIHILEKRLGSNVVPYYITKRNLENALYLYSKSLKNVFDDIYLNLKMKV